MNTLSQFQNILETYRKHGWRLARVLSSAGALEPMRRATVEAGEAEATVEEAGIDALWFTRPSDGGREAWELRLVSETPYALFELFEPDEDEEDREQVRREMEARMKEKMAG